MVEPSQFHILAILLKGVVATDLVPIILDFLRPRYDVKYVFDHMNVTEIRPFHLAVWHDLDHWAILRPHDVAEEIIPDRSDRRQSEIQRIRRCCYFHRDLPTAVPGLSQTLARTEDGSLEYIEHPATDRIRPCFTSPVYSLFRDIKSRDWFYAQGEADEAEQKSVFPSILSKYQALVHTMVGDHLFVLHLFTGTWAMVHLLSRQCCGQGCTGWKVKYVLLDADTKAIALHRASSKDLPPLWHLISTEQWESADAHVMNFFS